MKRTLIGLAATLMLLLSAQAGATTIVTMDGLRHLYESNQTAAIVYVKGLANMWMYSQVIGYDAEHDRFVIKCAKKYSADELTHAVLATPVSDYGEHGAAVEIVYRIYNDCYLQLEMKSRNPQLETGSEDSK